MNKWDWSFVILVLGLMIGTIISTKHVDSIVTEVVAQAATQPSVRVDQHNVTIPPSPRRSWDGIIVHHSGAANSTVENMDRYHKGKDWQGIGYHFVISTDGKITSTFRWLQGMNGAHTKDHNGNIGICLIGNFEEAKPPPYQVAVMKALIKSLQEWCGPLVVAGHGDKGNTKCPGKYLEASK